MLFTSFSAFSVSGLLYSFYFRIYGRWIHSLYQHHRHQINHYFNDGKMHLNIEHIGRYTVGMVGIGSLTQNTESKCYCRLHLEYNQAITSQWVKAPCVDKPIGLRSKNLLTSIPSCSVFGECTSASNPIPYSLPLCYVISMCTSYFSDFADRFLFACAAHITTMPYAWQLYSFSSRQRLGCTLCSSSRVSLVSLHRHWQEDQSACDTSLCMWHHTVPLGS